MRKRPLVSLVMAGLLAVTACSTNDTQVGSTSSVTAVAAADKSATTTDAASTTQETIDATAAAAEEFLATLSEEQKEKVLYDYNDDTKTTSWSNFPVTFVERSGLKLGDLNQEQQKAALKVLKALLNDDAYAKVTGIMEGDQYLYDKAG
ncbi:DUF3500 domain-containing protein, partial [Corynebacterium durum]